MKIDEILFCDSLPSIDLHGFDRDTARVKVLEFIKDNKVMKNEFICIIHGRGSGILKDEIHRVLKNNKDIIEYKLFYNNPGCTIVHISLT